jgi:chemotaxis receptor (MCP) glutamine deamidase CheD
MTLCKIQLPLTHLNLGEACYTDEPALVVTSLRSSVAVMMYNRRVHFAGVCHVRPVICKDRGLCSGYCDRTSTHVDCATKQMLEVFEFLGINREEIAVKLFGSADAAGCPDINIFKTIIINKGLQVADTDWGVTITGRILFSTHTGEVLTKLTGKDYL